MLTSPLSTILCISFLSRPACFEATSKLRLDVPSSIQTQTDVDIEVPAFFSLLFLSSICYLGIGNILLSRLILFLTSFEGNRGKFVPFFPHSMEAKFLDLLAKHFILKASNFDILFYLEITSTRCFLSVSNMLGATMKMKLTKTQHSLSCRIFF